MFELPLSATTVGNVFVREAFELLKVIDDGFVDEELGVVFDRDGSFGGRSWERNGVSGTRHFREVSFRAGLSCSARPFTPLMKVLKSNVISGTGERRITYVRVF